MTYASALRLMAKKPAGGGGSLSYAYLGVDTARPAGLTHTFSAVPLGDPDADRWIIAYISHSYSTQTPTVTIGGVTATLDVEQNSSAEGVFLCRAHVPSGTTGDITITTTVDVFDNCAYALWRVVGEPSLVDSDTIVGDPTSAFSVDTSASGFVVVGVCEQNEQHDITWTGVTERFDVNEGSNAGRKSGADTAGTGSVVSGDATASGSGRLALVAASYEPA